MYYFVPEPTKSRSTEGRQCPIVLFVLTRRLRLFLSTFLTLSFWHFVHISTLATHSTSLTFLEIGQLGRLGNQLFQVAATVGIAEKNGLQFAFPATIEATAVGQLFSMRGDPRLREKGCAKVYETGIGSMDGRFILPEAAKVVSLTGFFQSPMYFEGSKGKLRELFNISPVFVKQVVDSVPEIAHRGTVTLHVRRGDYLQLATLYNVLGAEFYVRALKHIRGVRHVVIVSDDLEWCARELVTKVPYSYTLSPFNDSLLDFVLLHLGTHKVLSSSTFSWWAAYLSYLHGSQQGVVIAPYPWYNTTGGLAHLNKKSFYLEHWTLLNVTV